MALFLTQCPLSLDREIQVVFGCLLRLLDEAVQQHKLPFEEGEKDACLTITAQFGAQRPKSILHRPAERHTHWPTVLQCRQILPDLRPIRLRHLLQPLSDRLVALLGAPERNRDQPEVAYGGTLRLFSG